MDKPFDVVVVRLLRDGGTIAKTIAKSVAQFHKLRGFFLLGDVNHTISIKEMDEGHRLTFATDIFPQCFLICSRSCLTSSGRMRDLGKPMLLEIPVTYADLYSSPLLPSSWRSGAGNRSVGASEDPSDHATP